MHSVDPLIDRVLSLGLWQTRYDSNINLVFLCLPMINQLQFYYKWNDGENFNYDLGRIWKQTVVVFFQRYVTYKGQVFVVLT